MHDIPNLYIAIEYPQGHYSLMVAGPIIVAISQIALAIREIAINTQKENVSSEVQYKSLELISYFFPAVVQ